MIKNILSTLILAIAINLPNITDAQTATQLPAIDVVDMSIKVSGGALTATLGALTALAPDKNKPAPKIIETEGETDFVYAFSAGDQVIFNFSVVDNKDLKEFEVLEYPSTSRYK